MAEALPADARVTVVAGGGTLPGALVAHLRGRGIATSVLELAGEAGPIDGRTLQLGNVEGILRAFAEFRTTHAVLVGWVRKRPRIRDARLGRRSLAVAWSLARALSRGDDSMLRAAISAIEAHGIQVVAVQDVWPELLAEEGLTTQRWPTANQLESAMRGIEAARAIGRFDTGQALVIFDRRIVALEGLEGTDEMLGRVARLRDEGRIAVRGRAGLLVKVCKPGQDLRADLPTIGPATMVACGTAGLAGVVVEAGRTLLLDRERSLAEAEQLGLFVYGVRPAAEAAHGMIS